MVVTGNMTEVINKEIEWLWKPFIPYGKVTLVQGDTGVGKTNVLMKVIADVSRGLYPPTMERDHLLPQVEGKPQKIFYVSIENNMEDTIAPIFDQFHGNRENVMYQDERQAHFTLNVNEIRDVVAMTGAKVIVIDPWQQFVPRKIATNNDAMRELLCELQDVAEETGAAVILTGNFTKGGGGTEAQKGIGVAELSNTLRCILTVTRCKYSPYVRLLRPTKVSLLGKQMTPVALHMKREGMRYLDYLNFQSEYLLIPKEEWDRHEELLESGVIGAEPVKEERKRPSALGRAVQFLQETLSDGAREGNEVKQLAREAGISESTLNRAKASAKVRYVKGSDGSCKWMIENI